MKFALVAIVGTLLSFVGATPVQKGKDVGKIIKHKDDDIVLSTGKFSYVVHLETRILQKLENPERVILKTGTCGGVIIRPDVVLTAAHCIGDPKQNPEIFAWGGIVDTKKQKGRGQRIYVKSYKIHEGFVRDIHFGINYPNDIAILWLEKPFRYDGKYIKEAELPERNWKFDNKRGWAIGWGLTESKKMSAMLQKTTLRAISQKDCQTYYSPLIITSKVICAISDNKNSIVDQGDSGGPLIVQGKVVGLSSFGFLLTKKNSEEESVISSDPKTPAIYTAVSKYIAWINHTLENGPPIKPSKTKSRN